MSPKQLERRSLTLPPEDWEALEQLAEQFNSTPPSGPTAGQPSWRSLIKEIARGDLQLIRPGADQPDEPA